MARVSAVEGKALRVGATLQVGSKFCQEHTNIKYTAVINALSTF